MASHLDHTLGYVLEQLQDVNFGDGPPTGQQFSPVADSIRETLAKSGISTRNIILIGRDGRVLQIEPEDSGIIGADMLEYPEVKEALKAGLECLSIGVDNDAGDC